MTHYERMYVLNLIYLNVVVFKSIPVEVINKDSLILYTLTLRFSTETETHRHPPS